MQNDYLDTQILLHKDDSQKSSGKIVSGKIIFTPKMDLSIEELGYQVNIIVRNKYFEKDITLDKKIIFRNKVLKKEEIYSYDIEFEPVFSTTFLSSDLKLKSNIETIVKLQTSNYLKVRNDYLKKKNLTTFTNTNRLLWSKKKFSINRSRLNYMVEERSYHAKNQYRRSWIYFFLSSIFMIFWIFLRKGEYQYQLLGISIGLLFIIFIVPQLYKEYILNSIDITTKQVGENQFGVFLGLSKTWNRIKSVKTTYGIFGSILISETQEGMPYEFDLYISPPIEKSMIKTGEEDILDFPDVNYDFIFDFPKSNLPPTFENDSVSFYWEFKISVFFFFGLKSEFVKEIKVKQISNTSTNINS